MTCQPKQPVVTYRALDCIYKCKQIQSGGLSPSLGHKLQTRMSDISPYIRARTQSGPSLAKQTSGQTQINFSKYFLEMGKVEITLKFCLGYSDHCRSNKNMNGKPHKMYFVTHIRVPKKDERRKKGDIILIFYVSISGVQGDLHARTTLSFISPLHWSLARNKN